jgi:hypothetical protein
MQGVIVVLALIGVFFARLLWHMRHPRAEVQSKSTSKPQFTPVQPLNPPKPIAPVVPAVARRIEPPVYGRSRTLFTPTEMHFYKVLEPLVFENRKLLFAKVRLEDMVYVRMDAENPLGSHNKTKSKHIDFVVCDANAKPLLAIELDDRSHGAGQGDATKSQILHDARIPYLSIPVKSQYDPSVLSKLIRDKLSVL